MNHALHLALLGAAAGAAGTTALNVLTYVDIAWRGRPASSTPETTVERLSEVTHVPIPGNEEARENRVSGLGPLIARPDARSCWVWARAPRCRRSTGWLTSARGTTATSRRPRC